MEGESVEGKSVEVGSVEGEGVEGGLISRRQWVLANKMRADIHHRGPKQVGHSHSHPPYNYEGVRTELEEQALGRGKGSELRTERGFLGNGHLLASGAAPCPDSPAGHKGAFQRAAWKAVFMSSPKHSQMAPDTAPAQLYRKTRGCIAHRLPATNSHGLLALILLHGTHLVTPSSGNTVLWPLRPPLPLFSLPALTSPICWLRLLLWPQKMGFLKAWLRPCSNLSL